MISHKNSPLAEVFYSLWRKNKIGFNTKKALCATSLSAVFLLSACTSSPWTPGGNNPNVTMPNIIQDVGEGKVEEKTLAPLQTEQKNTNTSIFQQPQPPVQETPKKDFVDGFSAKTVAGVWQASIGGMKCQVSTPRTKLGKGYRVSTMLCPLSLAHAKYWIVKDKTLIFYNARDKVIATLYPTQGGTLVGQSSDKEPIVLMR